MKTRKLPLILGLCTVMALTSCGASSKTDTANAMSMADMEYDVAEPYYADDSIYTYEEAFEENGSADVSALETSENASTSNRKLIKNVNLSVETKEYDSFLTKINTTISELGGYIQNMDVYNGSTYRGSRSARNASITARIPAPKLDTFVNTVGEHSNVVSRNESVEDITLSYVDMDSHKRMLEAERDRLLQLLDQCETIEDMITVEERLTSVRYQIDSMESQLRTYDNLVDYSTVYLNVSEVIDYTVIDTVEKTSWERISEGFTESLNDVMNGIKEFCIWFIINLPRFIMFAVIVTVIIFIIKSILRFNKKYREHQKAKKEAKAAKKEAKKNAKLQKKNADALTVATDNNSDNTVSSSLENPKGDDSSES